MPAIVDTDTGRARLVAEVDRAVRYRRPVTIALVRIPDDAEAVATALRPMDLLARDQGDRYLLILPELGRRDGLAAVETIARGYDQVCALCPDDGVTVEVLLGRLRDPSLVGLPTLAPAPDMRGQLAEIERATIVAALETDHGNQTRAARRLGLSRRALIYKMEKFGLKAPPAKPPAKPPARPPAKAAPEKANRQR